MFVTERDSRIARRAAMIEEELWKYSRITHDDRYPSLTITMSILHSPRGGEHRAYLPFSSAHADTDGHPPTQSSSTFVVFVGSGCGLHDDWDVVCGMNYGVCGVVIQEYMRAEDASAYAEAQALQLTHEFSISSWLAATGIRPRHDRQPLQAIPRYTIEELTRPSIDDPLGENPLGSRRWYIVFKGAQPGIYKSYVRAALWSVPPPDGYTAIYYSASDALAAWEDAVNEGKVECLIRTWEWDGYPSPMEEDEFFS